MSTLLMESSWQMLTTYFSVLIMRLLKLFSSKFFKVGLSAVAVCINSSFELSVGLEWFGILTLGINSHAAQVSPSLADLFQVH